VKRLCYFWVFLVLAFAAIPAVTRADDADSVKNGYLPIDRNLTVGEAFDRYPYFSRIAWNAHADAGRRVVEVTVMLDTDTHPHMPDFRHFIIEYIFEIYNDGTFQVIESYLDFKKKSGEAATTQIGPDQTFRSLCALYAGSPDL